MSRLLRNALPLVLLATLCACQPIVRPNLEGEASTAFPLPEETIITTTLDTPAESLAAIASGASVARGSDVFARINKNLSPQSCSAGSNSELWRRRYAGYPAAFSRHVENILPLLDFVSVEVERAGLPSEFVFIPLVESWYRPDAIGPGGPAGMWQMIGSTARNHGIHIRPGYDGRLSPVESTRAALSYLKTLQDMFGDWQAIVMAYNAGEGRLMKAYQRAGNRTASAADRKPHGLSNITYDYVAKLQALSCLISQPERQGLTLPSTTQFVRLAPVLMDSRLRTIDQFAATRGQNAEQLRHLNPGYKGGRVPADVPRLVLTPTGEQQPPVDVATLAMAEPVDVAADEDVEAANAILPTKKVERPSTHTVRSGESLWSIAKLHSMTINQLRRVNRLGRGAVVRPGQMLKLVP
jgi:membrane-bound lytic murein transglycosylase D